MESGDDWKEERWFYQWHAVAYQGQRCLHRRGGRKNMRAIRCRTLSSGHDVAAVLINSQEVWTTSQKPLQDQVKPKLCPR